MMRKKPTKISLVGGGNIGGTIAMLTLLEELGELAIIDIAADMAKGKALDLSQAATLLGSDSPVSGGGDWAALEGSDVVIITAGLPRKPGMSRSDLVVTNTKIIGGVGEQLRKHCSEAFVIVITNPLDAMVWVVRETSGIPTERVVGMAGILDSARFRHFLATAMGVSAKEVSAMVLGGHGDSMVPLVRHSTVGGVPLPQLISDGRLSKKTLDAIVKRTRGGGGEIVALLGSGSAYYAPAAAVMEMCLAYLKDQKRQLTCAAWLNGQYGQRDVYAGVPVIIGGGGVEKIVELSLETAEAEAFADSVAMVRRVTAEAARHLQK